MNEIQRTFKADSRVTIVVGQARKETQSGKQKEGTAAFLFDISMTNQWNFDQLMETAQELYEKRKPLKFMRYIVRFERRHVPHKGVRFQLDGIIARSGSLPSMVQIPSCLFEVGLDPEAVLHAEEATLPGIGICPVFSGKVNLFLEDEYCANHGTTTANEDGEPTHKVSCPPPAVLVKDGIRDFYTTAGSIGSAPDPSALVNMLVRSKTAYNKPVVNKPQYLTFSRKI